MPKGKRPPLVPRLPSRPNQPQGILELERFSEATLTRWNSVSEDLDELQDSLYFGVQPEQRRVRQDLINAIAETVPVRMTLDRWVRIVTFQYSVEPLSCAESLHGYGGRFNAGADLDAGTLDPWPCLYIAEDCETAFREKFQLASNETRNGLTPQELALTPLYSHSTVYLNGTFARIFDMCSRASLDSVAKVLGRIKMPDQAKRLKQKLRIPNTALSMIRTGPQLHDSVLTHNWRMRPVQFGLPAPSHTLAELVGAAGFEAILFRSTKGDGRCLAVFPDLLVSGSFVALADAAPQEARNTRLDVNSADELAGWDTLPAQKRPR